MYAKFDENTIKIKGGVGVGETGNFLGHVFKYSREHLYSIVQGVLTRNPPIFFAFLTIFGETALFSITNQQNS